MIQTIKSQQIKSNVGSDERRKFGAETNHTLGIEKSSFQGMNELVMHRSTRNFNILPPGKPPRVFELLKNSRPSDQNGVQMTLPYRRICLSNAPLEGSYRLL